MKHEQVQTGIHLKKFYNYIRRNYGPRCDVPYWSCHTCHYWGIYDDLKDFLSDARANEKFKKEFKKKYE